MKRAYLGVSVGVTLLFGSLALDVIGSELQSLSVLVLSFIVGVAGAVVALRGILDFLGEKL